jgi:DNA helicase IV
MRDTARHRVATGAAVAGDRYTAETLGRMLRGYAKELDEEPDGPLYFGRVRFSSGPAGGDHRGQTYRIGRRHIADEAGEPLVIDWRAPVSRVFYRATARDRLGVVQRRRYGWSTRGELTGYEDEDLKAPGPLSRFVREEIERPRVGPMRDIVATIQPEQDDLIRAGLDTSVCVQGAPGTGKTAVGLHRAAYLLYTHRRRLKQAGVLVIGPNPAFLRYISAVLPMLGEVDVAQRTLDNLLDERPPTAVDTPAAAAVKHDVRMAEVIARALDRRVREPDGPLVVADGSARWRVSVDALRRLVREVRAEGLPYALGRERLRHRIVGLLRRQAERYESRSAAWHRRMGGCAPVRAVLDHAWPRVRPADLIADVLADPPAGILTEAERAEIRRPKSPKRRTAADAVLVDEAAGLIDHLPGFGHIVVDEAQDLSPMQCRALARRSRHGSLTVLGDLAQGTAPWAARNWADQLAHLGAPDAEVVPLTMGFRVPAVLLAPANRLLAELAVDLSPTTSVRTDGALEFHPTEELAETAAECVRRALKHEGSVAVIAADAAVPALADRIASDERLTVLPASLVKGLEFDHVVLVEPAEIVDAEPRGRHRLYVALTRAVSRLDVVHHRRLPSALRG